MRVDAQVDIEKIDWDLVSEIAKFKPFGEGNEEPVFLTKDFVVDSMSLVGNGNKHLKMIFSAKKFANKKFEAIYFKGAHMAKKISPGKSVSLIYHLRSNEWNGNRKIEIKVIEIIP